MRITQTLILRLLVDPSEPEALRGVLQTVASGEEHAFSDAQSLLAILRLLLDEQLSVISDQLSVISDHR